MMPTSYCRANSVCGSSSSGIYSSMPAKDRSLSMVSGVITLTELMAKVCACASIIFAVIGAALADYGALPNQAFLFFQVTMGLGLAFAATATITDKFAKTKLGIFGSIEQFVSLSAVKFTNKVSAVATVVFAALGLVMASLVNPHQMISFQFAVGSALIFLLSSLAQSILKGIGWNEYKVIEQTLYEKDQAAEREIRQARAQAEREIQLVNAQAEYEMRQAIARLELEIAEVRAQAASEVQASHRAREEAEARAAYEAQARIEAEKRALDEVQAREEAERNRVIAILPMEAEIEAAVTRARNAEERVAREVRARKEAEKQAQHEAQIRAETEARAQHEIAEVKAKAEYEMKEAILKSWEETKHVIREIQEELKKIRQQEAPGK